MGALYRISCAVDSVVVAESTEDAQAYAASEEHHVHVEPLSRAEVLVALDAEEATVALAALAHAIASAPSDPNSALLGRLRERIVDAIVLIDEQERMRAR